jgi:hypothetical protein
MVIIGVEPFGQVEGGNGLPVDLAIQLRLRIDDATSSSCASLTVPAQ